MKQIYKLNNLLPLFILVVGIGLVSINQALDINKPKNRHNLFDPIYAFDDIDAHTVSVNNNGNNQQQVAPTSTSSSIARSSATAAATTNRQQQLIRTTPAVLQRPAASTGTSNNRLEDEATLSRFRTLPKEIQRNKKEIIGTSTQQHRALISPTFGSSARLLEARNAKLINNQDLDLEQAPGFRKEQQQPAHWSALENYYQKLRLMSGLPKQQQPQAIDVQPIYQILQQQEAEDSLNGGFRPLQAQNSPYSTPLYNNNNNAYITPTSSVKSPSPFLLPISANTAPGSGIQQATINSLNINGLLPNVDTDYSQAYSVSGQKQYAPGVSRVPLTNGQQRYVVPTSGPQAFGSGSTLQDRYTQEQIQIANNAAINNQQPSSFRNNNQWLLQSQPGAREFAIAGPQSSSQSVLMNSNNNNNNQPILDGYTENGRVKYLEWRKLPELLLIQQQQQRAKHQQETFGPWYDHQRSKELLLEEAYCGPRNYLNFNVANLMTPASNNQAIKNAAKIQYSPITMSKQLQQALQDGSLDVPVTLNADEYPSHMGVYNGSRPSEENFLCSATWIHEQFALTLASCFKNIRDPTKLVVRSGEWLLNRNATNDQQQKAMLIREIEQIYLFPKYRNDSLEHNLAIIKFNKPIEFLDAPYICPACQIQSRTSLRTSSCWAPVRNTTMSEYFDAEGEGETKEKKNVAMIEVPIKLIANDDNECYKQTRIEFFNFQHPNYICSADFRTSRWRARLNETDYFGSGIYCNEGGNLNLVSILHPIQSNSSSTFGYMDLSYYKPWMRNIISGRSF